MPISPAPNQALFAHSNPSSLCGCFSCNAPRTRSVIRYLPSKRREVPLDTKAVRNCMGPNMPTRGGRIRNHNPFAFYVFTGIGDNVMDSQRRKKNQPTPRQKQFRASLSLYTKWPGYETRPDKHNSNQGRREPGQRSLLRMGHSSRRKGRLLEERGSNCTEFQGYHTNQARHKSGIMSSERPVA